MNKKHHILSPINALMLDCAMKDGTVKSFMMQKVSFNQNLEIFDIEEFKNTPMRNNVQIKPDAINFAIVSAEAQVNISGIIHRNSSGTLKYAPYKGVNGRDVFLTLKKNLQFMCGAQFDSMNDVMTMVIL